MTCGHVCTGQKEQLHIVVDKLRAELAAMTKERDELKASLEYSKQVALEERAQWRMRVSELREELAEVKAKLIDVESELEAIKHGL